MSALWVVAALVVIVGGIKAASSVVVTVLIAFFLAVLLTPVLRSPTDLRAFYPGLEHAERPVLLVAGKADPLAAAVAHTGMATPATVSTLLVGGDHALSESPRDNAHVRTAIGMVRTWLQGVFR